MEEKDNRILVWIGIGLLLSGIILFTCSCSTTKPTHRTKYYNNQYKHTVEVIL